MDRSKQSNQNQSIDLNFKGGHLGMPYTQRPALLPKPNSPAVEPLFSLPPPNIGMNSNQQSSPNNRQQRFQNFATQPPSTNANSATNSFPQHLGNTKYYW